MLPGEPTSQAAADIPHSAEVLGTQTFLTGAGLACDIEGEPPVCIRGRQHV